MSERLAECVIVVPTLGNRLGYLEQALQSIRNQDAPVDVVVVTPESADGARQLAARFDARVVDDPGGLSAAVNAGLANAGPAHRYGNWIGDDDLLVPGSISAAVECLARRSDASVVYGHCSYIDGRGHELWVSRAGNWAPRVLGWGPNLIPQPGMLFRIDDFLAVGGLDESLKYSMDLDLLLRLKRRGQLIDLKRPVSAFRWHADSLTVSDRRASLAESEAVKRRYLSPLGRKLSFLWERPVRVATMAAVQSLSRRGRHVAPADK